MLCKFQLCTQHAEAVDQLIVSPRIPISRGNVALWGRFVSVSSPWSNKGRQMAVLFADWDTVVTIPGV